MSSTTSPTSTSTSSSSASSSQPFFPTTTTSSNPSTGTSSSLYLFTFLATLLLLLTVSCAIVVRSFILRRRFRRRVQEAIDAGVLTHYNPADGSMGIHVVGRQRHSRRRREVGEKPKLIDVYVRPPKQQAEHAGHEDGRGEANDSDGQVEDVKYDWASILPLSATVVTCTVNGERTNKKSTNANPDPSPSSSPSETAGPSASLANERTQRANEAARRLHHGLYNSLIGHRFTRTRSRRRSHQAADADNTANAAGEPISLQEMRSTEKAEEKTSEESQEQHETRLEVTVMIAMPTPHGEQALSEDALGLPDICFGVAHVPWDEDMLVKEAEGEGETGAERLEPSTSTL